MSKGKSIPIIIGTRGSELALWQANFTKDVLEKNGFKADLKIIKTKGDATQQWNISFDKIEGKGFFTKELEDALLANEIDLAVHSCKDLPSENAAGLTLAAFSKRANPFDILLIRKDSVDQRKVLKLKENAVVGTSSSRRKAQLLAFREDLNLVDMRGNVPGRVNKLKDKNYDAIVLASAGLERLKIDLEEFEKVELKAPMFIPAAAQGVLAFQTRVDDDELKNICTVLNDPDDSVVTAVERKILNDFQGGCQIPLGIFSKKENNDLHTWISYAEAWNAMPKRIHFSLPLDGKIPEINAQNILNKIKSHHPKSVFISSDINDDDYLPKVLKAHGYKVSHESFIDFKQVEFTFTDDADWLFFSSRNGVKYFFEKIENKNSFKTKLAAINSGTAQAIFERGLNVDFIGEGSDLKKIAYDFDEIASGKIIFPQAKTSMQTIQQNLIRNANLETLVIYDNQPKRNINKREEDILIFTSPMSVEAYLSNHKTDDFQVVISIGKTTTNKLNQLKINNIKTAYNPSMWCIVDEVFAIL